MNRNEDTLPDWQIELQYLLGKAKGEGIPEDISFMPEHEQYGVYLRLKNMYSD